MRLSRTTVHRLGHASLYLLFLAGGLGTLAYGGPGRELVRGSVGDVLIVPFLVHMAGIALPRRSRWRLAGVGVLAIGTELLQLAELVTADASVWLHLSLGSTFDLWDLLGYAIGLALAACTELALWRWIWRGVPTDSGSSSPDPARG